MKVAITGYGYWGPNVVRSLCRLLAPEEVIVCDDRPEALERAQADQPGIGAVGKWSDLISDPEIDAVYLCTPAGSHYSMTLEALAAGKHVLVEKPFTTNSAQARMLFAEARRQDLALMAGHLYLHSAAVRTLRDLIADGELGELRYIYSRRTSLGPRAREEVSVVWDYLAHDAYIIPYLVGEPAREVTAHGGAYLRPGIADVVFATLRFPGGVLASCQASWYDPRKVRDLVIVGSRKMAVFDDMNQSEPLVILDSGYKSHDGTDSFGNRGLLRYERGATAIKVNGEPPLLAQCRAFLGRIASGHASAEDETAVLNNIMTLEAVERSLKDSGAWEILHTEKEEKAA